MNFNVFKTYILRTENRDFESIRDRLSLKRTIRLLHGSVGVSTEAGELLDAVKKYIFYGKPIDRVNIKEEIGDALYYIALLMDELDLKLEDILEVNISKLRTRYPDKFSEEKAENRDLQAERKILEQ